jgi:hypothetical protein
VKRAFLLAVLAYASALRASEMDPNGREGRGWLTAEGTFQGGSYPGGDKYTRGQGSIDFRATALFDLNGGYEKSSTTTTGHSFGLEFGLHAGYRAPDGFVFHLESGVPLRLAAWSNSALVVYAGPRIRLGGDWSQGLFQVSLQVALRYALETDETTAYSIEARVAPMQYSTSPDTDPLDPSARKVATDAFDRIDYSVTLQRIGGAFLAGLRLGVSPMRDIQYSAREYGVTIIGGWAF